MARCPITQEPEDRCDCGSHDDDGQDEPDLNEPDLSQPDDAA